MPPCPWKNRRYQYTRTDRSEPPGAACNSTTAGGDVPVDARLSRLCSLSLRAEKFHHQLLHIAPDRIEELLEKRPQPFERHQYEKVVALFDHVSHIIPPGDWEQLDRFCNGGHISHDMRKALCFKWRRAGVPVRPRDDLTPIASAPRRRRRESRRSRQARARAKAMEEATLKRQAYQRARRELLSKSLRRPSARKERDRRNRGLRKKRKVPRSHNYRVKLLVRDEKAARYYRNLRHTDRSRRKPVRVSKVRGFRYLKPKRTRKKTVHTWRHVARAAALHVALTKAFLRRRRRRCRPHSHAPTFPDRSTRVEHLASWLTFLATPHPPADHNDTTQPAEAESCSTSCSTHCKSPRPGHTGFCVSCVATRLCFSCSSPSSSSLPCLSFTSQAPGFHTRAMHLRTQASLHATNVTAANRAPASTLSPFTPPLPPTLSTAPPWASTAPSQSVMRPKLAVVRMGWGWGVGGCDLHRWSLHLFFRLTTATLTFPRYCPPFFPHVNFQLRGVVRSIPLATTHTPRERFRSPSRLFRHADPSTWKRSPRTLSPSLKTTFHVLSRSRRRCKSSPSAASVSATVTLSVAAASLAAVSCICLSRCAPLAKLVVTTPSPPAPGMPSVVALWSLTLAHAARRNDQALTRVHTQLRATRPLLDPLLCRPGCNALRRKSSRLATTTS